MASKQDTTRKWVTKFCDLMDWFIGVEKVHPDNLHTAHVKGLAASYLAVKLGISDRHKNRGGLNTFEWELLFGQCDWESDNPEPPSSQERREYRRERMKHWRHKAEEYGVFRTVAFSPEVTPERLRRYCDCLEAVIYRAHDWNMSGEVAALGRQANDLAVKLGLTHPDWLLAMDLEILPYSVGADEIRELPLPWEHDKPPVVLGNPPEAVKASEIPRIRESLKKAQSLLPIAASGEDAARALRKLENPVKCTTVAGVIHRRSDNVASTLKRHRYPVIIEVRKSYCDAEDAAVLWPKWRKYWEEKKKSS